MRNAPRLENLTAARPLLQRFAEQLQAAALDHPSGDDEVDWANTVNPLNHIDKMLRRLVAGGIRGEHDERFTAVWHRLLERLRALPDHSALPGVPCASDAEPAVQQAYAAALIADAETWTALHLAQPEIAADHAAAARRLPPDRCALQQP